MSIRGRLVVMCFVVALLPAIPLTLLVQNLIDKSLNVGLSETMSDALESGMEISRKYMIRLQLEFEEDVLLATRLFQEAVPDSIRVGTALRQSDLLGESDGYALSEDAPPSEHPAYTDLPADLAAFSSVPALAGLADGSPVTARTPHLEVPDGLTFYETESKSVQLALWDPAGPGGGNKLLLIRPTDPEFLSGAGELLASRQIFAQLRFARERLSKSFFYPFIIIYGIALVVALGLALLMGERMSSPIRRLSSAAAEVATGNWRIRIERNVGGEIGGLTDAFNSMVGRLDGQQRRLLDMEKMAAWREMARHLAHEIKNPLLPIRLAVQEMRDQYGGDDDNYMEFLTESTRVVEDELEHLQRLVKEFSSFAKMPGLSLSSASLEKLTADVAKLYPKAETRISTDRAMIDFPFDQDQIRRVLVNLFDNAIAAGEGGGQAVIEIRVERRGESAALIFKDNGPGIEKEHLERIFDPYFTTRGNGTGLGLAIVKSIVLMHGGTIEAASSKGEGATFTVTFPIAGPGEKER